MRRSHRNTSILILTCLIWRSDGSHMSSLISAMDVLGFLLSNCIYTSPPDHFSLCRLFSVCHLFPALCTTPAWCPPQWCSCPNPRPPPPSLPCCSRPKEEGEEANMTEKNEGEEKKIKEGIFVFL
jgi:hypothetical protein